MKINKIRLQAWRLIFLVVLMFSVSVCFAGEKEEAEEEAELNSQILEPITDNFSDSSSFTRLVSLKMIEFQERDGQIKGANDRKSVGEYAIKSIGIRHGKTRIEEMLAVGNRCKTYDQKAGISRDELTTSLVLSWKHNVANCNLYARMVMTAFAFNRINKYRDNNILTT